MKKYVVILVNHLQIQLTYKFNVIVGLFNQLLGVLVALLTWSAIFSSSSQGVVGHFTRSQMFVYLIIVNFSTVLFSMTRVSYLGDLVHTGKLTMHLLRPYSFLGQEIVSFLGDQFLQLLLYLVAIVSTTLVIGYEWYYTLALLVLLMSNLMMFSLLINFIANLGFWMIQTWPLRPILNAAYSLLGGLLFPLNLLPNPLYQIVVNNPFSLVGFQYTLALQHRLLLAEIWQNSILAFLWSFLFYIGYLWSFKCGLKRYEGMGA
ncbi:hypothetical protein [Streptococcus sciuri]|uniref:ABC transporter permease n=1 Tax=Streptococcus sciuri TaxID=2973939 RepID=A0ABT2F5T7_9STRE|nr:hypothetical protein [Streptococcus sciuri]MCS4487802.1 hypothetical protein [Streptococcus sciuri]